MGRRSKFNHSRDKNHVIVTEAIEALSYETIDVTGLPAMGCDILAAAHGQLIFVEIKNGDRWKLTDGEIARREWCHRNGIPYLIIESVEDAQEKLGRGATSSN